MNLELETNTRSPLDLQLQLPTGAVLMLSAPSISDRWLFRVRLGESAAVLAVPQFGGVNIWLQSSGAGGLNLPYEMSAGEIMRYVRERAPSIPEPECSEAIKLLKKAVTIWRRGAKGRLP
jgi:hypothetical protein